MKSKKLLSFLLAFCMMLSMVAPAGAITVGEDAIGGTKQTVEQETNNGTTPDQAEDADGSLRTMRNDIDELLANIGTMGDKNQSGTILVGGDRWSVSPSAGFDVPTVELPAHIRELKEAAQIYDATDLVSAFVLMETAPLVDTYSAPQLAPMDEIERLEAQQAAVIMAIEEDVLEGRSVQVDSQLTFLTNGFAITTEFGNLEAIANIPGVKSVFLVPVYYPCVVDETVPVYKPYTVSSGEMSGVPTVWEENGFTGEGTTIAILDTGLDMDHPSFAADPASPAWDTEYIASVLPYLNAAADYAMYTGKTLTADDLYYSAKIPFAFSYPNVTTDVNHNGAGDHGTHVAGISAANKLDGTGVVGMAPDAQLVIMKVFGTSGGASTIDIVAALEDALTLGVDVVNMSLGTAAGFSETSQAWIDDVYASIANTEVVVNIAAGNEANSSLYNMWGTNTNPTTAPDNATVASPSTYANVNSIASMDNSAVVSTAIIIDGKTYMYNDGSYLSVTMADVFYKNEVLEYVMVPGVGNADDFATVDVEGKVAVVYRGEISFVEKLSNAEANGAIALIVINNVEGSVASFGMSFEGGVESGDITGGTPAILVSMKTGEVLEAQAEEGNAVFTVSPIPTGVADEGGGQVSVFSSWGIAPDLRLLPDLSGVGGNVYSTVDDGNYDFMSGTSMACPQVSGLSALVMQYLKEEHPELATSDVVDALLMSTAVPTIAHESGVEASPRQQGAGLANALNAVNSGAYITVDGDTNDNKPKAELGDSASGTYSFTFTVHNFSDESKTYNLHSSLLTEDVDASYYSVYGTYFMAGYDCELDGTVTFSEDTIVVPAGGSVDVTVDIALDRDGKMFLNTYYPNGGYVEGYVYLMSEDNGGVDMSIPFLGFYGDWTEPDLFDTAYWYDNSFWASMGYPVNASIPEGNEYYHIMWTALGETDWVLGFNPYANPEVDYEGNVVYDPANNVVSPNGDGYLDGLDEIYLSLMRNAKELHFQYIGTDGTVYYDCCENEEYCINVNKTMFNSNYGQVVPYIYSWYYGGWTPSLDHIPDGTELELIITGKLDYEGEYTEQTLTIPLSIDVTAPTLVGGVTSTTDDDGNVYLNFTVKDEHLAYVVVTSPSGTQMLATITEFNKNSDGTCDVMVDVTGKGTELSIALCDYGANESFYDISFDADGDNLPDMDTEALYAYRIADSSIADESLYGWVTVDPATGTVTALTNDMYEIYAITAAEYVDGTIFAFDAGYNFVVIQPGTFFRTTVCNTGMYAYDMTWDETTDTMYVSGKMLDEYGYDTYYLCTLDLLTGELEVVYENYSKSSIPYAMTATADGTIYAVKSGNSYLYTVDKETGKMNYVLDAEGNNLKLLNTAGSTVYPYYAQSMTYSEKDDCIYWAYASYGSNAYELFTIHPATETEAASYSSVKPTNTIELIGMLMLDEDEDYEIPEADEVEAILLSASEVTLLVGDSGMLEASILPWNFDSSSSVITWTSSDENVVTVVDGMVTAVGRGSATITATCDGVSATCDVAVLDVSGSTASGYALVSVDTAGSMSYGYWFDLDLGTMELEPTILSTPDFQAADYNGHDGYIYGYDGNKVFYRMDPKTGSYEKIGVSTASIWDMAYDYSSGLMYGIDMYGCALYTIDMTTGEAILVGNTYNHYYNPLYPITLACNAQGQLFTICAASSTLYYLDTMSMPGYVIGMPIFENLPYQMNYVQSMWYDHNSGGIVWAQAETGTFVYFDLELMAYAPIGSIEGVVLFEYVGMHSIPEEIPALPDVAVESFTAEDTATFVGGTKQILTQILPLNATVTNVVWTSANETIAKVDANGVITGVSVGTTTITGVLTDTSSVGGGETFEVEISVTVMPLVDNLVGYYISDLATGGGEAWGSIDVGNPSKYNTALADSRNFLYSAEYVDTTGYIYTYGYNANDDLANWEFTVLNKDYEIVKTYDLGGEFVTDVYDLAFDYTTGTMFALASPNESSSALYMVDLNSGSLFHVQDLDAFCQSMVIDENGRILVISDGYMYEDWDWTYVTVNSKIYEVDISEGTMTELFDLGCSSNMFASAAYDYDTGYILWSRFFNNNSSYDTGLVLIDVENEKVFDLGTINAGGAQVVGLLFNTCESYPETPEAVYEISCDTVIKTMVLGETAEIGLFVRPYGCTVSGTWTSSDETVATVDENGVVTAVGSGSATITFTVDAEGKTLTASCKIVIFSSEEYLLSYNVTDGCFVKIDRNDATVVIPAESVGGTAVAAFDLVGNLLYGYDVEGKAFVIDLEYGFERTYLGAHGFESIADDYGDIYDFYIRDMAWDAEGERMLVLGAYYCEDVNYEIVGGNRLYSMDLTNGALTELTGFAGAGEDNNFANYGLTVPGGSEAYSFTGYWGNIIAIDPDTGVAREETCLQVASLNPDLMYMAYDELTGNIFMLLTTNGNFYQMWVYDMVTGVPSKISNTGDVIQVNSYTYQGDTFAGLVSVTEHIHFWGAWTDNGDGTHSHACECGYVVTEEHDCGDGDICAVCGTHFYSWSAWEDNGDGTHSRFCDCGLEEKEPHTFYNNVCIICGAESDATVEPEDPDVPDVPVIPNIPVIPDEPINPSDPFEPSDPVEPSDPEDDTIHTELPNGVEGETEVDNAGNVISAEVEIPADVAKDAAEEGKPVELPIPAVPNTGSSYLAPEITVNTNCDSEIPVEIPVENVTPGTVVVIVDKNGVETVIPTTSVTENGVVADLPDGATVKVIDNSKYFSDVESGQWYSDAVDFASARGILNGTGDNTFDLDGTTTRAMVWTMLARLSGVDTTTGANWYDKGLEWAIENGISDGSNADGSISREQLAVMLWRLAGSPKASDSSLADVSGYTDGNTVSSYAQDAMAWAVANGLINGMGDGILNPNGNATRAQVAKILMSFINAL